MTQSSKPRRPIRPESYAELVDMRKDLTEEEFIEGCRYIVGKGYTGTLTGAAGAYEYEGSEYYTAKAHICEYLRRKTGKPGAGI